MYKNCEIVRDLLPLYADCVCSKASEELVEAHLASCSECAKEYKKMTSDVIEDTLIKEKESVMKSFFKKYKRKSTLAGMVTAGILLVPVIICLIVNLASSHSLDWFFIVLSSLAVTASLTVVPMLANEYKFTYSLVSFTASLMLLLGVCCIYTKGTWFFVSAASALFGISVFLLPFALRFSALYKKIPRYLSFIALLADTVTFVLMMLSISTVTMDEGYAILAFSYGAFAVVTVWAAYLILHFIKDRAAKWLVASFLAGAVILVGNSVIGMMIGSSVPFPHFRPYEWSMQSLIENLQWLCFIAGVLCLILAIVRELYVHIKEKRK